MSHSIDAMKVALFKQDAEGVEFGGILEPPIPMGGPFVKHLVTKVKLYGGFKYDEWATKAIIRLGSMTRSFEGPIEFYRIGDPPEDFGHKTCLTYTDGNIFFREVWRELDEKWTEPAEDIDPADFEARKIHPACLEVRFDMVIKFRFPGA